MGKTEGINHVGIKLRIEFADKKTFSDEKFRVEGRRRKDGKIIRQDRMSSVAVM